MKSMTMAESPWNVVPYYDPYDDGLDIQNLIYDSDPSIENIPAVLDESGAAVPSLPGNQDLLGNQDFTVPDQISPMCHNTDMSENGGENNIPLADEPSQFFGFDQNPAGCDQNLAGFGNVMPLPVPTPFRCCGCQVLREIIHFNSKYVMRLEIHGRIGVICHAVQESRGDNYLYDNYQTIDFFNKSIEEVKHFLMQYCIERKVEGYIMQQDPLQAFYQTLCVGMEYWDDNLCYPDEFIHEDLANTEPNSGARADEMEQQPVDEAASTSRKGKSPRLSLAEQRERTANMNLDDLRAYFHLTIEEASEQLRVCPTVVKRICRKFGVSRWPARKIKSIERQISSLRPLLNSSSETTRDHVAAEIKRLEEEITRLVP